MLEKTRTQRNQETCPRLHSLLVVGFHYKLGALDSGLQSLEVLSPFTATITIEEADLLGLETFFSIHTPLCPIYLKIAEDVLEDANVGDGRGAEAQFCSAGNGEDQLQHSVV